MTSVCRGDNSMVADPSDVVCETSTLGITYSEVTTAGQHDNLPMSYKCGRQGQTNANWVTSSSHLGTQQNKNAQHSGISRSFSKVLGLPCLRRWLVTPSVKGVALMQLRTYAVHTNALGTRLSFMKCVCNRARSMFQSVFGYGAYILVSLPAS